MGTIQRCWMHMLSALRIRERSGDKCPRAGKSAAPVDVRNEAFQMRSRHWRSSQVYVSPVTELLSPLYVSLSEKAALPPAVI